MGANNDTVTRMLDRWKESYADLIGELSPEATAAFQRLRATAHKHSAALNRKPVIDYERPLMLVLLIDLQRQVMVLQQQLAERTATARVPV